MFPLLNIDKYQTVEKSIATSSSFALELQTHSKQRVRKPYLIPGTGVVEGNLWLSQVTGYDYYGFPEFSIDENGYLSSFSYDKLGRIHMMWLPHDHPSGDIGHTSPVYTSESHRIYDKFYPQRLNCGTNWVLVECQSSGSPIVTQYVCDPFHRFNDECACTSIAVLPEVQPAYDILNRSIVGYLNYRQPLCPNEMALPQQGGSFVGSTFRYPKEVHMGQSFSVDYPRSEHSSISAAKVKLNIVATYDVSNCFNFEVVVRDQDLNEIGRSPILSVYCENQIPVYQGADNCEAGSINCSPSIVHPGTSSTGYRTYNADITVDLQSSLSMFVKQPTATNIDYQRLHVEVRRVGNAYGVIELGGVRLEVVGRFRKWNDHDDSDFTLAMFRNENKGHTLGP